MQLIPAIKALSKCETPIPDLLPALLLGLALLAVVCLVLRPAVNRRGEYLSQNGPE